MALWSRNRRIFGVLYRRDMKIMYKDILGSVSPGHEKAMHEDILGSVSLGHEGNA